MGRSLVVLGADFSANAIIPEFVQLDYIIGSDTDGSGIKVPSADFDMIDGMSVQMVLKLIKKQSGSSSETQVYTPINGMNSLCNVNGWCVESTNSYVKISYGNKNNRFYSNMNGDEEEHTLFMSPTQLKLDDDVYNLDETAHLSSIGGGIGLDCYQYTQAESYKALSTAYVDVLIKEIKIWNPSNSLVIHAIPVKRTLDNVVCFFNIVNNAYYERNDGTTPHYILNGIQY